MPLKKERERNYICVYVFINLEKYLIRLPQNSYSCSLWGLGLGVDYTMLPDFSDCFCLQYTTAARITGDYKTISSTVKRRKGNQKSICNCDSSWVKY